MVRAIHPGGISETLVVVDVPARTVGSLPDPSVAGPVSCSEEAAPDDGGVSSGPAPEELLKWRVAHAGQAAPPCANCGTPLNGPYCHACGQPVETFDRSLGSLFAEGFEHLFHADFRLFHTLPRLALKPGLLTREYLAGRRYSQTPPLRLFLVVVLIVFLAGSLRELAHPFGPLIQPDAPIKTPSISLTGGPAAKAFSNWLNPRLAYEDTHQREFAMAVESWLHRIAIVFLPISTLLLGLLFVFKRGIFLYDHAIFSMHSLSFMGLLFTAITLVSMAGPLGGLAGPLVFAAPTHLFFHLRGVYKTSIPGTFIRMLLLFVLSAVAVALLFAGVFALELNGMGTKAL
jgi:hypothetical protein